LNQLDVQMRLRAARLKKEKLKNPNVFLSKTRIVIRNLPKDCDDKRLKRVAIEWLMTRHPEANRKKLLRQVKVMRENDRLDQ